MSKQNPKLWLLCALLWAASCSPKIIPNAQEDFAQYRKHYDYEREVYTGDNPDQILEVYLEYDSTTQKFDITERLHVMLDYIPKVIKKPYEKKELAGWRIQIYRGRSREAASRARERCYNLFQNRVTPYLTYSAPTYRVKVGDFLERYEYADILKALRREFPDAIPVPDKVNIIVRNIPKRRVPINESIDKTVEEDVKEK